MYLISDDLIFTAKLNLLKSKTQIEKGLIQQFFAAADNEARLASAAALAIAAKERMEAEQAVNEAEKALAAALAAGGSDSSTTNLLASAMLSRQQASNHLLGTATDKIEDIIANILAKLTEAVAKEING